MRFGIALLALAIPAFAADYTLELKPENTKVQWALSDVLHTVHGTFSLKHGTIDFNTDTGKASGQVIVDVASGQSGSEARDSRMHANVLESKKYPEAIFTPDRVEGTLAVPGSSTVKVHGTFTIHGAAHETTMDVRATVNGFSAASGVNHVTMDEIRATMAFDIPYVAWGMKDPSNFLLKVSKTVQVSIEAAGPLRKH